MHDWFQVAIQAKVEQLDDLNISFLSENSIDDECFVARLQVQSHEAKKADDCFAFIKDVLHPELD